jgi:hypothetical protein
MPAPGIDFVCPGFSSGACIRNIYCGGRVDIRCPGLAWMKVAKPKKNYQAEEIGKLRAAVAHREKSIAHYRELVEKHSKALHRQSKEIRRLRRELAAKNVVIEAIS